MQVLDEPKNFGALFVGSENETRTVLAETKGHISRLVSECEALHADKLSLQQQIQQATRRANQLKVITIRLTSNALLTETPLTAGGEGNFASTLEHHRQRS